MRNRMRKFWDLFRDAGPQSVTASVPVGCGVVGPAEYGGRLVAQAWGSKLVHTTVTDLVTICIHPLRAHCELASPPTPTVSTGH